MFIGIALSLLSLVPAWEHRFSHIDVEDGLTDDVLNTYAHCLTSSGLMYFGGPKNNATSLPFLEPYSCHWI